MTKSHFELQANLGRREELLRKLDELELLLAARDEPGFLGASVQVELADGDRVLVEASWSSPEHFERWQARGGEELLRGLGPLLAAEPLVRLYRVVDAVG